MRMREDCLCALSVLLVVVFLTTEAAFSQASNMSRMEKLLDRIDQPGNWPAPQANGSQTRQLLPQNAVNQAQPTNPSAMPGLTTPTQNQSPFTPQNILRVLLGGPSKGTTTGGFAAARGNVQEDLQTSLDQASRAESACGRASSGSDRELRMSAAEEARYAASAAREAADRASSRAQNTTGDVSDLAAQARDAADRAQAAADRATANAEGGGW
jgi:hypothetical protein